ncbi:MAG: hypothetical protein GTO45_04005 [Candidatus Aminicenantes bacterium]|nr:hypothetical protein [Candidatus Aminicenantes bacterium]NIM77892.1 hypothetical protein [Candidatus Aminicenantes bacterium]NIN17205.1 hypothetical protein [Candidatus Aminicenantes bacterium]NIN41098.1 hypothetical protein [Candidatus Aminicenantes bacterium]NIN83903.1 hypothetical protein [Candidatus Aminicenantes bacterium]
MKAGRKISIFILLALVSLLFAANGFAWSQKKLVSIKVTNGSVGRRVADYGTSRKFIDKHSPGSYPKKFYPEMTLYYSDGTQKTMNTGRYTLVSTTPSRILDYNCDTTGHKTRCFLSRFDGAKDCTVTCKWKATDNGATVYTTSTVEVKGQIDRIEVTDGKLGRSGAFYPTPTRYYTDGTVVSYIRTGRSLVSTVPDIVKYEPGGLWRSYFARKENVPDSKVECTWTATDGVTVTGTSIIEVKGQIHRIEVDDGEVGEKVTFKPTMTRHYTDGTVESGEPVGSPVSKVPDIVRYEPSYRWHGYFARKENAPNGFAACTWELTDGVTAACVSTVAVTGRADGTVTDNSEGFTTKETPYNSPTKNKDKKPCPPNKAGTACSENCSDESRQSPNQTDEQAGDPININNLEFVVEETDLEIPGRGINYKLERTYRSRINFPGVMGWNWCHNYHQRFVPHPDDPNVVIYYNGYGRGDPYTIDSGENHIPPEYHFKKLLKDKDGYLLLRNRNGTVCKFYPLDGTGRAGRLAAIITRCGNSLVFKYHNNGKLYIVLDSLSRKIQYFYNDSGRLEKVKDFMGREVRYSYSPEGDLIAVTSPAVTGTPNTNDFPNGKTIKYTYSSGYEDLSLNHNLLTITSPNETAVNGPPSVINHYNDDDRLIKQEWGGTNSSGIPAGGTIIYSRREINQGVDPDNLELPREVVTIKDRSNNETVYSYNINKNLIKKEEKTRGIRPGDPAGFITQYKYTPTGLLHETIQPDGTRTVSPYDTHSKDQFQTGNQLSSIRYPDSRGADQHYLKVTYQYEPVYNQLWKVIEERGNDPDYKPQNKGKNSPGRYTTEYIPDYFEGGLDTQGCCGQTLRDIVEMYDIDISSIKDHLNQGDLNGDGKYSICGNIIVTRYPSVHLRTGSPQAAVEGGNIQDIEKRASYNKFGQIEWEETPEGEITQYLYYPENDPDGDGKNKMRGRNNTGQPFDKLTGGYLKEIISDFSHSQRYRGTAPPAKISAWFGYDRVGNTIYTIDGRGIRTDFAVNQLNQVVEVTRAADVSESKEKGLKAFGYKSRTYYDYNNNVIKSETEYRDGNNPDLPQFIDTTITYDILDNLLETTSRVNKNETVTRQKRYDANGNVIETISPMAAAGLEPGNRVKIVYDERDRAYQVTNAPGTTDESTVTSIYDINGNLVQAIDAEDNDGDGKRDVTTYVYDGYDRLVKTIDAAGNEIRRKFDPASNVIQTEIWGNSNNSTGNVLLARTHTFYDELSRVFRSDSELFVPAGVTTKRPVKLSEGDFKEGDGWVSRFTDYDRNSRVTFNTAASPANEPKVTGVFYDGLGRDIRVIDPEGNETLTQYDRNSNPVRVTSIDKNPSGRVAPETFTTVNVYDSLDRLVRTTDNIGQTRRFYYDSRGLLIKTTDAQGPIIPDPLGLYTSGNINADGNAAELVHDGLGRTLKTIRRMKPEGKIIETSRWDKNSRVVSVSDDKGNTTSYAYDNLNRLVKTTFADGTTNDAVYDRDSNVIRFTDNNGTVSTQAYDALNRRVSRKIKCAKGVGGTTRQTFEYDGMSRLTRATDNNNPYNSNDDSVVERKYDSLGRPIEEIQDNKVLSMNWTGNFDPKDQTYPNDRKIEFTLDKLNRLTSIKDSEASKPIAAYDYIGGRVLERTYANGTRLTMLNNSGNKDKGYDKMGRLVKMRHLKGSTPLAAYTYAYNRENMKKRKLNLTYPHLSEFYKYDSVYRLVNFKRGMPNKKKKAVAGTPIQTQTWKLDGVGNWFNTTVNGVTKTQSINNMNEYETFASTRQVHDNNGNLIEDGKYLFTYDFANRIIKIRRKKDNSLVSRYTYDAFNRRTSKFFARTVKKPGSSAVSKESVLRTFYYNQWRVKEERERVAPIGQTPGAERVTRQFVDGPGIDEHLCVNIYNDSGTAVDKTYYFHENHSGDTAALTDDQGNSAVRLEYSPYGEIYKINHQGKLKTFKNFAKVVYAFQGRRIDEETGIYYFRNRYYDAKRGRFQQRDPLGYRGSMNLYEAFGENPKNITDPLGLYDNCCCPGGNWTYEEGFANGGGYLFGYVLIGAEIKCDTNKNTAYIDIFVFSYGVQIGVFQRIGIRGTVRNAPCLSDAAGGGIGMIAGVGKWKIFGASIGWFEIFHSGAQHNFLSAGYGISGLPLNAFGVLGKAKPLFSRCPDGVCK